MAKTRQLLIDVKINKADAASTLKELKTSIKDLQNEAIRIGEGGQGFKELISKAGQLQDKLNDVRGTTQVLAGNVAENLTNSFSKAATAGIGGFQAIAGAQAVFGSKNKDLQEQLVKLQGLLSLSQGIKEFANIGQAAKDFGVVLSSIIPKIGAQAVATEGAAVATKSLNLALLSNPYVLVTAALIAVTAAMISYNTSVEDSINKQREQNLELEKTNDEFLDLNEKFIESALRIKIANGEITQKQADLIRNQIKKEGELRNLRLKYLNDVKKANDEDYDADEFRLEALQKLEKKFIRDSFQINQIGLNENSAIKAEYAKKDRDLAAEKNRKFLEEQKRQIEEARKESKRIRKERDAAAAAVFKEQLKQIEDQEAAKLKAEQDALDKTGEELEKGKQKIEDIEKAHAKRIEDNAKEIYDYQIELADKLVEEEKKAIVERVKNINKISAALGQINQLLNSINQLAQTSFNNRINEITNSTQTQIISLQQIRNSEVDATQYAKNKELAVLEEARQKELSGENIASDQRESIDKSYQKKKNQIEKDAALRDYQIKKSAADAEYKLRLKQYEEETELKKKAFEVNKAVAIAQAAITGAQASLSAYASQLTIPSPDAPIRAAVAAGIAGALALAQIAAIAATQFNPGQAPTPPAPVTPPTFGNNFDSQGGVGDVKTSPSDLVLFGTAGRKNNIGPGSENQPFNINVNVGVSEVTETQKRVAKYQNNSEL